MKPRVIQSVYYCSTLLCGGLVSISFGILDERLEIGLESSNSSAKHHKIRGEGLEKPHLALGSSTEIG